LFVFLTSQGSRRALRVTKGQTVAQFLREVCQSVEEARGIASDALIFVKAKHLCN
jgi:hypothetical protein